MRLLVQKIFHRVIAMYPFHPICLYLLDGDLKMESENLPIQSNDNKSSGKNNHGRRLKHTSSSHLTLYLRFLSSFPSFLLSSSCQKQNKQESREIILNLIKFKKMLHEFSTQRNFFYTIYKKTQEAKMQSMRIYLRTFFSSASVTCFRSSTKSSSASVLHVESRFSSAGAGVFTVIS